MRIADVLTNSGISLTEASILLAAALKKPRSWVFAHPEDILLEHDTKMVEAMFLRRRGGEPIAYITGEKEFYGRLFAVDARVLIPRPSTEELIEKILGLYKKSVQVSAHQWAFVEIDTNIIAAILVRSSQELPRFIVDVGTGSGCIALTLALEIPDCTMLASDISENALAVARSNCTRHGLDTRVTFVCANGADVFSQIAEPFFLVSNPPYIPEGISLERDVLHFEPHQALFGGVKGTDVLKPLVGAALANPNCKGVAIECRRDQQELLHDMTF